MAKQKNALEGLDKFNRVSPTANIIFTIIFILAALMSIIPLVLVIIISITDKQSIALNGYSFFPDMLSIEAYETVWAMRGQISRSFFNSVFVTVVGTLLGLVLNATFGYVLSRSQFKFKKLYTWIVFIPMIFSGGMVSNYLIMTQLLQMQDTYFPLIVPGAVSSFYIIILRTFFTSTVPDSLIESGKIDGATQARIFAQIVLPISLPALATVSLFLSFGYWNDWFQAMLYIETESLIPLQYLLIRMDQQLDFMIKNASAMGSAAMSISDLPQEGFKMAVVVVTVLPIACTYPFFQRYFISGLTIGAVKG